ncbi:MAG: hypothetical protein OXI07_01805 [Gammaproteobacteria bacterium]|nr:hypothetical protein [Gammaproteobacteria bacterium]
MDFNFNGEEFNSPIPRRNRILTKPAVLSDQIARRFLNFFPAKQSMQERDFWDDCSMLFFHIPVH